MRPPRRNAGRRDGAASLEFALVSPVLLLLVIGGVVAGMGIFRYQQLSALAREGSRWASVRGQGYQEDHKQPAPTSSDVFEQAVRPRLAGIDPDDVTCTLSTSGGVASVTLTYRWAPEAFLPPVTLSSTAVSPITY